MTISSEESNVLVLLRRLLLNDVFKPGQDDDTVKRCGDIYVAIAITSLKYALPTIVFIDRRRIVAEKVINFNWKEIKNVCQ